MKMNIKAYRIDLDRALLQGPDALLAHMREYRLPEPSPGPRHTGSDDAQSHHHGIANPTDAGKWAASKSWLLQRGYHTLDDGDIWWT